MKKLFVLAALGVMLSAASCNTTSVTASICIDANALQGTSLNLNRNQRLALQGIISTCAATAGGTVFSNDTVIIALINDAILLQNSGLLTSVHIKAEAPENQVVLRKVKLDLAAYPELKPYLK